MRSVSLTLNRSRKIGVITVTYNSGRVIDGFLDSIASQAHDDFVLYVVDNASHDSTIAKLEAWGDKRLRVIANAVNAGIAEADNQGIRAALADGCDYVLLLNNDIEFEAQTFAVMIAELEGLDCDLLAPKIFFEDRVHIWSAGGTLSAIKGYLAVHRGEGEIDQGQFDTMVRIRFAPGCCILVRSEVFDRIGMIDAKYFVYHEDADFLFRAWRAGLTMCYTPRARIFHKVSSLTGGKTSPFTIRYNARGHVYFMLKNLGVIRCLFYLPALQVRMVVKAILHTISWDEYLVRQRAFFEGIAVWLS
jgi:GT2 family glycosyltransferase